MKYDMAYVLSQQEPDDPSEPSNHCQKCGAFISLKYQSEEWQVPEDRDDEGNVIKWGIDGRYFRKCKKCGTEQDD